MNVRIALANSIFAQVEQATTVDRDLLLDDNGFTKLFTNLINGNLKELSTQDVINQLTNYVNNNY
jgi:hypothetical protein